MRRRVILVLLGPAVAAVIFAALSPAAAIGGLHSVRAAGYVTLTMLLALGAAVIASRRSSHAWVTVSAGLLPAAIALGAITIPTLHQRELHEDFPTALAADANPLPVASAVPAEVTTNPSSAPVASPSPASVPLTPAAPVAEVAAVQSPAPAPTAPSRLVGGDLHGINHDASGRISVYRMGSTLLLRFEDVDIQRVPDAQVYLEPSSNAQSLSGKGLHLGASKAERGTFSYELPAGYELSADATLLVWCRAFDTPVANATLV